MRIALLLALAGLSACAPHTPIVFEMPAEITVPAAVRSLAVVDRKGSEASAAARLALQEELQYGERFRLAEPAAAQAALGGVKGTVGVALAPDAIAALRTAAGADGVVIVDQVEIVDSWAYASRLESRTRTEYRRPADCASCPETATEVTEEFPVIDATTTVSVTVGYQVYGVDGAVIDAWTESITDTHTGTGESEEEARRAAGKPGEYAVQLAADTAFEAARHISPWVTTVERRWYASGSAEVTAGAKLARANDWAGAEKAWRQGRKTATGDARGRLLFNLAVAAERRGDIASALELVKDAKPLLRNPKHADAYLENLRARKKQARALAAQMQAPPAE